MSHTGTMVPSVVGASEPPSSSISMASKVADCKAEIAPNSVEHSSSGTNLTETPSKNGLQTSKKNSVHNSSSGFGSEGSVSDNRTEVMDSRTTSTSDSGVNENCTDLNVSKESNSEIVEKVNGNEAITNCKEDILSATDDNEQEKDDIPEALLLTKEQLLALPGEELWEKWQQQLLRADKLQAKLFRITQTTHNQDGDEGELREHEVNERLRNQLAESQRKEAYHVMRLTAKEHELQEMAASVAASKCFNVGRCSLLDPAVNLCMERLKRDLEAARSKMEEAQNELSAWKFTPDSNTGKQLMAKCRLLIKENEELGRMISSGKLAKLEGDIALQRNFSEELKKSQSELDEFLLCLDEDTEGMQGTILYLQDQLRATKQQLLQQQQLQLNSSLALAVHSVTPPPLIGSVPASSTDCGAQGPTSTSVEARVTTAVGSKLPSGEVAPDQSDEDSGQQLSVKEEGLVDGEAACLGKSQCSELTEVSVTSESDKRDTATVQAEIESQVLSGDGALSTDVHNNTVNSKKRSRSNTSDVEQGVADETQEEEEEEAAASDGVSEPLCKRTKVYVLGEVEQSIDTEEADVKPSLMENGLEQ